MGVHLDDEGEIHATIEWLPTHLRNDIVVDCIAAYQVLVRLSNLIVAAAGDSDTLGAIRFLMSVEAIDRTPVRYEHWHLHLHKPKCVPIIIRKLNSLHFRCLQCRIHYGRFSFVSIPLFLGETFAVPLNHYGIDTISSVVGLGMMLFFFVVKHVVSLVPMRENFIRQLDEFRQDKFTSGRGRFLNYSWFSSLFDLFVGVFVFNLVLLIFDNLLY